VSHRTDLVRKIGASSLQITSSKKYLRLVHSLRGCTYDTIRGQCTSSLLYQPGIIFLATLQYYGSSSCVAGYSNNQELCRYIEMLRTRFSGVDSVAVKNRRFFRYARSRSQRHPGSWVLFHSHPSRVTSSWWSHAGMYTQACELRMTEKSEKLGYINFVRYRLDSDDQVPDVTIPNRVSFENGWAIVPLTTCIILPSAYVEKVLLLWSKYSFLYDVENVPCQLFMQEEIGSIINCRARLMNNRTPLLRAIQHQYYQVRPALVNGVIKNLNWWCPSFLCSITPPRYYQYHF
jgi:hypothetical protein